MNIFPPSLSLSLSLSNTITVHWALQVQTRGEKASP